MHPGLVCVFVCALSLLLAAAAQVSPSTTADQRLLFDGLRCIYHDWYVGVRPLPVTAEQLQANRQCCRERTDIRINPYDLAKFVPMIDNIDDVMVSGVRRSIDNYGEKIDLQNKCYTEDETQFITTEGLRNFVCNISKEKGISALEEWFNDTVKDVKLLNTRDMINNYTLELLRLNRALVKQAIVNGHCYELRGEDFSLKTNVTIADAQQKFRNFKQLTLNFLQNHVRTLLLSDKVTKQLYAPHVIEKVGQGLSMKGLNDMYSTTETVMVWIHRQIHGYAEEWYGLKNVINKADIIENETMPGTYTVWVPAPPKHLTFSYGDLQRIRQYDCWECCEDQRIPDVQEVLPLVAELSTRFYQTWLRDVLYFYIDFTTRMWFNKGAYSSTHMGVRDKVTSTEDQSNTTVSVDTSCVQLMKEMIDKRRCLVEDMPKEDLEAQRRCRIQLENNLRFRTSYVPVTSYLAYTQRININLCILSWMITNPNSICDDTPTFAGSEKAVKCFFSKSDDSTCNNFNFTERLCLISRELLWFRCSTYVEYQAHEYDINAPVVLRDYQLKVNKITLDYRKFTIDYLIPLEVVLVSLNITFRLLTIWAYIQLRQLRNVPGKALLSYQIAGLIQIFFSEVIYRFGRVPDIMTAVQVDSSFTLLHCLWLNVFSYEMLHCLRSLETPSNLHETAMNRAYRRYFFCTLIPWILISTIFVVLERANESYLLHSRIVFVSAVLISIALNMVLLIIVGCICISNRSSMRSLDISSNSKIATTKQLFFLSAKAFILSGLGIILRLGFHQTQGIAQWVYYIHLVTMIQGPILFVLFVCNDRVLPLLKARLLNWWEPDTLRPGQEMCSAAKRNLERRRKKEEQ